ncbi:MAG TPA: transcription-repair coupling factor [Kiritimatiellia bacterium]|nr:transcription-repair coupling factor [Kiritimatiellia bacterium]HPS08644.1 transcription-repair coupling factor [Kiritimatiellia bacterium]
MSSLSQRFTALLTPALPDKAMCLAAPALPGAAAALTAAALAHKAPARFALAVTAGPAELERVYGDLCALGRDSGVMPALFPQQMEEDKETAGTRLRIIKMLRPDAPEAPRHATVLVTSLQALLQHAPDPDAVEEASVHLRVGAHYPFDALVSQLVAAGYERAADVDAPGRLAVRGGLLDVWPPATPAPWRAEFFDTELESLRTFDPATQCSVEKGESVWLPPCSEDDLATVQLVDLLPSAAAVLWLDHDRIRAGTLFPPEGISKPLSWEALAARVAARAPWLQLFSGDPPPARTPALALEIAALPGLAELGAGEAHHPELLAQARQRLLADLGRRADAGESVIVCADTAGTCELLARELGADTRVLIRRAALSGGFSLAGLTVAAQPDLYAVRKQALRRPQASAAVRGGRVENAADLEAGDLVVHVDHGIGRFLGSTEVEVDGQRSEVFTIEYAEGAKLHVPVSHAHLLSRYVGVAGHRVKLHRLGGKRWTREKADAERAVADLAAALLDTQARRQVVEGLAFNPEPVWMSEFEAAFPYQETDDQEKVIADVKRDMAASRPMDRLICGDAGYGKTEIAMRAAFISVMNGRQVAVLVPTTVLAEQHYETFTDRMAAYPVKIDVVSRFHTHAKRKRILADVRNGRVDIVIGTHALLGSDVTFQNLGLLIIDEEQRFGVTHKERLKQVRQVVDVLTLSATPIPRTLYMSMTGARDMSLLQTPPRERVAVETKVARDSDAVVRSAIRQELNRGGQAYFLYNRVVTIGLMQHRLERLVPEARIAVAHGQMPANTLARIMREFEAGEIDVLLCTTIVESGLDIPRANTMLVHRADRFGIADLYQLRGRVGRSSQKGFAWLLLPEYGHVDEDARQRIAALQKHSGLGAGFNLALRDLEIRGAGNLLGAAQSGHIAAIGFGLYCQLLRRTIARLKGDAPPLLVDVDLALDFLDLSPGTVDPDRSACLPYAYVEDEAHRMILHRRLAEAVTAKEVRALRGELADRYGKPPEAVLRLLRLAELRVQAAQKKIGRIETRDNKVYLYRQRERSPLLVKGRLPVLKGKDAEQRFACIFHALEAV